MKQAEWLKWIIELVWVSLLDVIAGVDAGVQGLEEGQCLPPGGGAQVEDTVARPHVQGEDGQVKKLKQFHAHKFGCSHLTCFCPVW